jgi:hypothetical protein
MEEKIEKTFATPEGCDLVVENVRGEISVEGWDRPETEVVAVHRKGQAEIEITQDGRKVIARTKHERQALAWLDWLTKGGPPIVDYTVRVPVTSNLKLSNVNGPIGASQVQGRIKVNNVDGSASLHAIGGEIKAETVNGSLKATKLDGTAKLNTVNGKMEVGGGVLTELKADTVNGSIAVEATLSAEGSYNFHTVNGSCHLTVPPEFRAHVSAHGVNMSVDCQIPSESVSRRFGNWEGTIGTGDGPTAEIHFDTVNGRLRIDNGVPGAEAEPFVAKAEAQEPPRTPAPPEPPEAPTESVEVKVADAPSAEETAATTTEQQPTGKSQREILQMVEDGEISVEEAVKLLQE